MQDAIGPAGLEVVLVVETKRLYDSVLKEGGRRTRREEGGKKKGPDGIRRVG